MRATIFFIFLCSFFFCKGENLTVNRTHPCSTQNSSTQKHFLENQGLGDSLDQYNKIIEVTDTDTGEDSLNSDNTSDKFVPLNFETNHKWYITNSNFFYLKNDLKVIKNFPSFFGYSQPIYIIIRVLRI
jgi:hypothetical protein